MVTASVRKFTVGLSFEPIKLPPVSDILVLAKRHPQGKVGVMESFRFIAPDEFEMVEVDGEIDGTVEAVLINKRILRRMPQAKVLEILAANVFPYVSKGEAVKVDFNLRVSFEKITGELSE